LVSTYKHYNNNRGSLCSQTIPVFYLKDLVNHPIFERLCSGEEHPADVSHVLFFIKFEKENNPAATWKCELSCGI
jgi:hypothetical protein